MCDGVRVGLEKKIAQHIYISVSVIMNTADWAQEAETFLMEYHESLLQLLTEETEAGKDETSSVSDTNIASLHGTFQNWEIHHPLKTWFLAIHC